MAHAWQRLWLNLWLTGAHKTLRASFPPSAIWWWPINASLTCTPPPCRRSALCTRPLRCAPVPRALFLWLCAFCVKRACNRRSECALQSALTRCHAHEHRSTFSRPRRARACVLGRGCGCAMCAAMCTAHVVTGHVMFAAIRGCFRPSARGGRSLRFPPAALFPAHQPRPCLNLPCLRLCKHSNMQPF